MDELSLKLYIEYVTTLLPYLLEKELTDDTTFLVPVNNRSLTLLSCVKNMTPDKEDI